MNLTDWRTQWRMAGKYGYRREMLSEALSWRWDVLWHCWVRQDHLVKMDSHGRCYRCEKAIP